MRFLLLATFLVSGAWAHAQTVTVKGILRNLHGQKYLRLRNSQQWLLHPANEQTTQELERIHEGDFLFGVGQMELRTRTLHLHSIEKVGLKKLLGDWKSDQGGIFAFKSFSQVVFSGPQLHPDSELDGTSSVSYRLYYHVGPSAGTSWSIFLDGQKEVLIGRFRFYGDRLKMYFIDQSTGTITHRFKLTKLNSPQL